MKDNKYFSTAIVDADSILFSIGNGNKVLDDFGEPIKVDNKFVYTDKTEEELYLSADLVMNDIFTSCEADSYIIYIKGKGSYRKQFNEEYKSNRPKESPKWWNTVKTYLIDSWEAIEVNDIEVDDACRITKNNLENSFILAIDKDLLNLEGTHWNWRKKEWIYTDKEEAHYHIWKDMLVGQSGDSIKGISGIGEVGARQLLVNKKQYGETYPEIVLNIYIQTYGENLGIEEFYKTYKSLYILENYDNFVIPEVTEFKREEIDDRKSME